MNHASYINLMRTIATRHKDINHSEAEMHFARIVLTRDPFLGGTAQIREFINSKSGKLKYPSLLAISYSGKYVDNKSDNKRKLIDGGFIVLDKHTANDYDSEELVLDKTEIIAEEITGYLINHFHDNTCEGIFDISNIESEKLTNVGTNLAGIKFYFTIETPANVKLKFNAEKFI